MKSGMNRPAPLALPVAFALALTAGCGGDETTPTPACAPPATVMGRVPYYECSTAGVCPRARVRNDMTRPAWRITYLRPVSPSGIANAAVEDAVNSRMQAGTFLWGLSFDLDAGTVRTGGFNPATRTLGATGLGLLDGQYRYFNRDAAGMGDAARYDSISSTVTVTNGRATSGMFMGTVRLPVFNPDGSLFTVLPLTNLRLIAVKLAADRGCIGEGRPHDGRFAEHASVWNTVDDMGSPYGTVEADITAEEARAVNVSIGTTVVPLCDLLAGSACTNPMEMWPKQPDTMVNAMPAWRLRADFAAVSATVRP